jgi:hypothetical protein
MDTVVRILAALASVCLAAGLPAGGRAPADEGAAGHTVLLVSDFGAVGDGKTDDRAAIRDAIARAVEADGPIEVRFDRRVYRVGPREDRWCSFDVQNARDITIDGQGAILLLHPHNCGFLVYRSRNIVLRNFVIDYDPLPHTQGDVVSLDPDNGAFTVRIHQGYPIPESIPAGLRHGAFIEPETPRYTGHWLYIGSVECLSRDERLVLIKAKEGDEGRVQGTHVGERFVFGIPSMTEEQRNRRFARGQEAHNQGVYLSNPAGTIQFMLSKDCTVESIDHYMSTGMTYRLTGTENVRLRHIRIIRRPGTDRLVASLSDGIHCKNNKVGPFIEHCTFEALLDDSINLSTMSDDIMETVGPTTFLTLYSDIVWYDTPIAAGDTVLVFDPVKAIFLGEAQVTHVEFVGNRQRRVTLDRAPEGIVDAKMAGREKATKLFIKKLQGAQVKSCVFRSQMKTAMVFRTPGVCEGNYVEDCFFGVHSHNSLRFGEGPIPYDLCIRGNTFDRVAIAAIAALRLGQTALEPYGGPVRIEDNTFHQENGTAIRISNLTDVHLQRNSIRMHSATPDQYAAIHLANCADTTVSDCRIVDPRVPESGAIRIEAMPPDAVKLARNLITR